VKSGGKIDITKLLSLLYRCNKALIWLPFSWYLVAGKMAKVKCNRTDGIPPFEHGLDTLRLAARNVSPATDRHGSTHIDR
jgi:hypothetical protein